MLAMGLQKNRRLHLQSESPLMEETESRKEERDGLLLMISYGLLEALITTRCGRLVAVARGRMSARGISCRHSHPVPAFQGAVLLEAEQQLDWRTDGSVGGVGRASILCRVVDRRATFKGGCEHVTGMAR